MGDRFQTRRPVRLLATVAGFALILGFVGCGAEEELKPDEGVSPFFTGKAENPDGPAEVRPVTKLGEHGPEPAKTATSTTLANDGAAPDPAKLPLSNPADPFSFEELDKLNKTGVKLMENGAFAEAAKAFDQVLGAEPENRLALLGRASVGTELLVSLSEQDRITEIGRSADLMRTLKKTYKTLNARESNVYGIALFNEAVVLGTENQPEMSLAVLKEAVDEGFDRWAMMESTPGLKSTRNDPRYRQLLTQIKDKALKEARQNSKRRIDQNVGFPFQFKLKDLDGKPVSSADLKGKIVLVDFWGTWCGPCISAIPGLIELHRNYADQGLAVVGLAYEHVDPDKALPLLKQFVEANKVPYPCAIGDEATRTQIPNFVGFPTTLILDETGKVRFLSVGAQPGEAKAIEDAVIVLLDDMKTRTPETSPKTP